VNKGLKDKLFVCEMFSSIQGEGSHAGYPCFFIRLSGCNLRCTYCDTRYAFKRGKPFEVGEIISAWDKSGIGLVLITGGEPLLQPSVYELMQGLLERGATCLLETNGSLNVSRVPHRVVKILDWKTPGSGHEDSFDKENLRFISQKDQIKFVIVSKTDYEWVLKRVKRYFLDHICEVIFSPAHNELMPEELASWMLDDLPVARLQIQLHKLLWGDRKGI